MYKVKRQYHILVNFFYISVDFCFSLVYYMLERSDHMSISATINSLLSLRGKKKADLADLFGVSKQAISNKFSRETWTASDLIKIADFCGAGVAFISGDMVLPFEDEEAEK